jgi:DNA-binding response OmpR family regulator
MAKSNQRILVIEDDPGIAEVLELNLRDEGYAVDLARDGESGLARLLAQSYGLLILDLMLPGIDGLEICRRLRAQPGYTPIIIVSSRSAEAHKVLGLELGADDYLTKPFSVLELVARVRALFRRVEALGQAGATEGPVLDFGRLRIAAAAREVWLDGQVVALTMREFDLLHFFARHPERVFTRLELLDRVWGYNHDGYEHTVNSHINRLRAKIEPDPARPRFVHTVWGVGYKFTAGDEAD